MHLLKDKAMYKFSIIALQIRPCHVLFHDSSTILQCHIYHNKSSADTQSLSLISRLYLQPERMTFMGPLEKKNDVAFGLLIFFALEKYAVY